MWALAFARSLWCIVVEREGLVLDTRYVPPAVGSRRDRAVLYLLAQGSWSIHGEGTGAPRFEAPCALLFSEDELEGAQGRRPFTFSARGAPYAAVEVHAERASFLVPPAPAESSPIVVPLDDASWGA